MSSDSTRMCELLVGLPDVNVLEVVETDVGLRVTIETRGDRPLCVGCGGAVKVKDRRDVEHADLPCFGRPTVLVWRKIRWECSIGCGAKSSTETAAAIAAPRQRLTDRAGRWATVQVGRRGRPVSDVASCRTHRGCVRAMRVCLRWRCGGGGDCSGGSRFGVGVGGRVLI